MSEPGYPLVSASYVFASVERARELGFDTRAHHLVEMARIPGEDWCERQRRLDEALWEAVRAALDLQLPVGDDGIELVLRIGVISDGGEQLGYALTSEFIHEWAALGGAIHIDS
ncbi:hypothetical protein [Agromyces mediolanus]|uniref:hypothetical protein n=1 Tax=Agromyces mediolanus TaxID=41986 RepID=UPI001E658E02|nr:hypothetical protein [Agromyces mediolanus]MCD1573267.1 hypothetical protein [Agromyces mediolanus]